MKVSDKSKNSTKVFTGSRAGYNGAWFFCWTHETSELSSQHCLEIVKRNGLNGGKPKKIS